MKKYLIAAFMLFLVAEAKAETFHNVPAGPSQALATADYGGVNRSTIAFSSANVLCFTGVGSVVGFVVSSGATNVDFLVFRDTASLISGATNGGSPGGAADDYTTTNEFARVYLSSGAGFSGTIVNVGSTHHGTHYLFPKPIRVYRGLAVKPIVATYNMVTILWNKLDK